jgi:hypothetical protein
MAEEEHAKGYPSYTSTINDGTGPMPPRLDDGILEKAQTNDADLVDNLRRLCTNANPNRAYNNLTLFNQG